ncbi:hypothetical protein SBY92_004226 [Candida maltosa Xu316]|uniref:DNA2/NAM7 helicase-like C-terminal domain-containing protein n=1 Tax=Candida maltosa (strain Xu316) TaxID=1245528 RepID=M3HNE1_CANMX|nr:hypothetical protein G210_0347 [Candida maltosa Xu316]
MTQYEDVAKLEKLTFRYKQNHKQQVLNDIFDIVFANGAANHLYLETLFQHALILPLAQQLAAGEKKETVKFYKLTLAVAVHSYHTIGGTQFFVNHLVSVFNGNDEKIKFLDKLADFAIDKTIKDTDFKIDILRFFLILLIDDKLQEYFEDYFGLGIWHSLKDPYSITDDEQLNSLIGSNKTSSKKNYWLLQLVKSFGNKSELCITDWQIAVAKFLQSLVSNHKYHETVSLFLKSIRASSYFTACVNKGSINAVKVLKHALADHTEFRHLKQELNVLFVDRSDFLTKINAIKSVYDTTREQFAELLIENLSLKDSVSLLNSYVTPKNQTNFEAVKYFTNEDDMKKFYIDICISDVFEFETPELKFWEATTESSFDNIPNYINFATNYSSFSTLYCDASFELNDQAKRDILSHLKNVASRITVTGDNHFSGTSKYFKKIEKISQQKGNEYDIAIDGTVGQEFKYALAITICKPSKESTLKKFGINKLRIGRLENKENKVILKIENLEHIEPTHLVLLPTTDALKGLDAMKHNERMRMVTDDISSEIVVSSLGTKYSDIIQVMATIPFTDISSILPSVLDSPTIVLTSSATLLQQYQDVVLIRYGDDQSVKSVIDYANDLFVKIQKCIDATATIVNLGEISQSQQLSEIIEKFLVKWREVVDDKLKTGTDLPSSFLEIVTSPSKAEDATKEATHIKEIISLITKSWILCGKELSKSAWIYICKTFSVMMTVDDFFNFEDRACNQWNFVFLNCDISAFFMAFPHVPWKNEYPGTVKIVGGNMRKYFYFKQDTTVPFSERIRPGSLKFNPGFRNQTSFISVKTQLDEAEYCVALYYYMRKLGYPRWVIGIWVCSKRQLELIKEIAESKLPRDIGQPVVVFNRSGIHDYDCFDYSIISLFSDSGYKVTHGPGKRGNYYISSDMKTDRPLDDDTTECNLQIVPNEKYGLDERTSLERIAIKNVTDLYRFAENT